MTYLTTKRVRLRPYREEDLDLLVDLSSDPEVMRYLTDGVPQTRAEVESRTPAILAIQKQFAGRLGLFPAELKESGEFLGWYFLRPDKADPANTKTLELGYRLKRKFWGQGLASEVCLALLERAFTEIAADSVFAYTHTGNLASQRVMKKIGMRFEGEFTDTTFGQPRQAVKYRLMRKDWKPST